MSDYYKPQRKVRIYDPKSREPFRVSRSKIDLFFECPRCAYLDLRLGTSRPPGFPFNLNSAVDALLKKEFDLHRTAQTQHPLMKTYSIDAVPYYHEHFNEWRENFKGVQHVHEATNFLVTGAVDDVWKDGKTGELIVVDYKATSKQQRPTLDAPWQDGYKRQMEVYQWLLRRNGHKVSSTGYFVYCNGLQDKEAFDGKLEFDVQVLPYTGNDSWIEPKLLEFKAALSADEIPATGKSCDYCAYRDAARGHEVR